MKNKPLIYKKPFVPFKSETALMLFALSFAFVATVMAQPSSTPEENLFFEKYTVEEQTYYLLPDSTSAQEMTEWDWIEMESTTELRTHQKALGPDLSLTERIDILERSDRDDWQYEIGYLWVDQEGTTVYDATGGVISDIPHSESYLNSQDSLLEDMLQNGLTPLMPFLDFDQIPIGDLQDLGFTVTETSNGYKMTTSTEEIDVNVDEQVTVHKLLSAEYGVPHYDYQAFDTSAQGYLIPIFKKTKTRLFSENGACIVAVKTEAYQDYEVYYDPSMIQEEQSTTKADFDIYPNPTTAIIQLEYTGTIYPSTVYEIAISNAIGEPVYSNSELNTNAVESIELNRLPEGYYVIHFLIASEEFTKNLFIN